MPQDDNRIDFRKLDILAEDEIAEIRTLLAVPEDRAIVMTVKDYTESQPFYDHQLFVQVGEDGSSYNDYEIVDRFCISLMPGCCGVKVIHYLTTFGGFERKGLGTWLMNFAITKRLGSGPSIPYKCGLVLATDITNKTVFSTADAMLKIFKKCGFEELGSRIKNPNSGNTIGTFAYYYTEMD